MIDEQESQTSHTLPLGSVWFPLRINVYRSSVDKAFCCWNNLRIYQILRCSILPNSVVSNSTNFCGVIGHNLQAEVHRNLMLSERPPPKDGFFLIAPVPFPPTNPADRLPPTLTFPLSLCHKGTPTTPWPPTILPSDFTSYPPVGLPVAAAFPAATSSGVGLVFALCFRHGHPAKRGRWTRWRSSLSKTLLSRLPRSWIWKRKTYLEPNARETSQYHHLCFLGKVKNSIQFVSPESSSSSMSFNSLCTPRKPKHIPTLFMEETCVSCFFPASMDPLVHKNNSNNSDKMTSVEGNRHCKLDKIPDNSDNRHSDSYEQWQQNPSVTLHDTWHPVCDHEILISWLMESSTSASRLSIPPKQNNSL